MAPPTKPKWQQNQLKPKSLLKLQKQLLKVRLQRKKSHQAATTQADNPGVQSAAGHAEKLSTHATHASPAIAVMKGAWRQPPRKEDGQVHQSQLTPQQQTNIWTADSVKIRSKTDSPAAAKAPFPPSSEPAPVTAANAGATGHVIASNMPCSNKSKQVASPSISVPLPDD